MPCCLGRQVGYAITSIPEDIEPHRMVRKVYEQRRQMIDSGEGVDWGFAEALAFGTLLSEGQACLLGSTISCAWLFEWWNVQAVLF